MKLHKSSFVVNLGITNSDGIKKWHYFNTLSRKFISLPDNLKNICSRLNTNEKFAEFLKRRRWITSFTSYSDEMKDAIELITTSGVNNRTLNIIFTLTTRCNLNCNYCFQNNVSRHDASDNVFLSLPSFIRRQIILKPTIKKLRLSLFGGEPLLMKSRCLNLLQCIKNECSVLSVEFESTIVTNGIGSNPEFWRIATECGLKSVQITIDGSEKLHDSFRNLNGVGTYRELLSVYSQLSRNFKIGLKYNLNRKSKKCFSEFLSDIDNNCFNRKNTRIILEVVKPMEYNNLQNYYFQPFSMEAANAYLSCAEESLKFDWQVSLGHVFQPPCMYTQENPSTILIRPDGVVSRCISVFNDDSDFTVGNINDPKLSLINHNIKKIIEDNAIKCKINKCPYFPLCMTGCPSLKKMKLKTIRGILCSYNYLQRMVQGLFLLKNMYPEKFDILYF